jgi:hypothetical protein
MKAYLVLDFAIRDFGSFREYIERVPAFIEKHGGRYIVQGAEPFPDGGRLEAWKNGDTGISGTQKCYRLLKRPRISRPACNTTSDYNQQFGAGRRLLLTE